MLYQASLTLQDPSPLTTSPRRAQTSKRNLRRTPMHPRHFAMKASGVIFVLLALLSTSPAQTVTTVYSFDGNHGANPQAVTLAEGRDGKLYGTTFGGGVYGAGTIFRIDPNTDIGSVLHSFDNGSNGGYPVGGLTVASDGNFYGTTAFGGDY